MRTDTDRLRNWIATTRWFGRGGRELTTLEVVDEAIVEDGPPALVLTMVIAGFADGARSAYFAPLLVDEDGSPRDALDDPGRLRVIGELMAHGISIKGSAGTFVFGGPGLDPLSPPGGESVRVVESEQSNTSLVLDDAIIVKIFRRIEPGANPDLELTRLLTNEGFQNIPLQVGQVSYEGEWRGGELVVDLGIAQQYVQGAVAGWDHILDGLREVYGAVAGTEHDDPAAAVEESAGAILDELHELGDVTASLHVTLSREELDPDLLPEPLTPSDLRALGSRIAEWADRVQREGFDLSDRKAAIDERVSSLDDVADPGLKIRIHGDFHLGQVLRSERGWLIIDFEGEPMRALEDRRVKQSPLKDVAGMLRSISYVASAAMYSTSSQESPERSRLERVATAWEELARDRFLSSYLTRSIEGTFLPPDRNAQATLLDAFELEKVLYELSYERAHRPDWIDIPARGLDRTLEPQRTQ